jgi:hypothetical protein
MKAEVSRKATKASLSLSLSQKPKSFSLIKSGETSLVWFFKALIASLQYK